MAVKLRLRRMGRRKLPVWGLVAADSRSRRDGRFIEDLGRYYPLEEPARVELNADRLMYWLESGAQPTDTVRSLLRREGILLALSLKYKGSSEEEIQAAVEAHRSKWADKATSGVRLTARARKQRALQEEAAAAAKAEAAEAEARAKEEAARKKAEEEARRKAAEEARAKAEAEAAAAEAKAAEAEAAAAAEAKAAEAPEADEKAEAAPEAPEAESADAAPEDESEDESKTADA